VDLSGEKPLNLVLKGFMQSMKTSLLVLEEQYINRKRTATLFQKLLPWRLAHPKFKKTA